MTEAKNVVIVGAGHAAGQLVQSLKQQGFDGHVTLIGEEPYLPYQRPPLSKKFLAGEFEKDRLLVKPPSAYGDVDTMLATRVQSIDRDSRHVETESGKRLAYDRLVLAVGARPRRLSIPGADLPGVSYLRTIQDVEHIQTSLQGAKRVAIVGAGYIGLEVAAVIRTMGLDVVVVEALDRVMSRVVSPQVSAFYQDVHTRHGVELKLSTPIDAFAGGDRVSGIQLASGGLVEADAIIVGIGVVPNTETAEAAGLSVDNGIVVDAHCRTSDPDIFAIGDCTAHPNPIYERRLRLESVHNALEQAKTAAANICGSPAEYRQVPWFWSDQYDLKLQIAGLSEGYEEVCLRGDPTQAAFSCLYLREDRLIAIDAINRPRDFMQAKGPIAAGDRLDLAIAGDDEKPLKDAVLRAS